MIPYRKVRKIISARRVIEGAGVLLHRAIGFDDPYECDPFLLFDDFRSDNPEDYRKGFPWHPHRGIETITYILKGTVKHQDSIGNRGVIGPGDIQWMTAGSGIYHQEMPQGDNDGAMHGFQLWANLPAKKKLTDPRYRDCTSGDIPVVTMAEGVEVKIIAGTLNGITGPITDVTISPEYFDVTLPEKTAFSHKTRQGSTVLVYVYDGDGYIANPSQKYSDQDQIENRSMVIFGDGNDIAIHSNKNGIKYLFISGMPIREPIAWRGPIVMNSQEELHRAYDELKNGTFVKVGTK